MSTRCLMGVINPDGTGQYIRCNCDGYPEWVGRLLLLNYPSREKALEVVGMGDLSCLGKTLEPKEKDDTDIDIDGTTAHHRDWGSDWAEVGPRELPVGFAEFDKIVKDSDCNYAYLHVARCWMMCKRDDHTWIPLARVEWRDKMPNPFDYPPEQAFKDCTLEKLKSEYHRLGENLNRITVRKREVIIKEIRNRGLNPHDVL